MPENEHLFTQLLACPDFDFRSYLEEAVVSWLERNLGRFLKEQPEACRFFINSKDYPIQVAESIPINDEFLPNLKKFLSKFENTSLRYNWKFNSAWHTIVSRLISAGRADLVLDNSLFYSEPHQDEVIKSLSDANIKQILDKVEKDGPLINWGLKGWLDLLEKTPKDRLRLFAVPAILDLSEYKKGYVGLPKTLLSQKIVSYLAQNLPYEDLVEAQVTLLGFPQLRCMACWDKRYDSPLTLRSKSGYTLHRKVCDPRNSFPNPWDVLAVRLKAKN